MAVGLSSVCSPLAFLGDLHVDSCKELLAGQVHISKVAAAAICCPWGKNETLELWIYVNFSTIALVIPDRML